MNRRNRYSKEKLVIKTIKYEKVTFNYELNVEQ
ncbi:hypothetical protein SAMN05444483_103326 [Salegentibacter echinorum]|uniref:Uncharacterized protein n=1 Tax=Salegentibacter echinorum TaxID=1073325 RepID=A0A1M5FT56_SALEC|nr:hypothetical protein SAMN05444483_103326 [Salegentibacter echinorum]